MAYIVYLDGVPLPVTPSKINMKITNQNKTINLINNGEVNVLKSAGLTEISFTAMVPHVKFPFAYYPNGFMDASFYLAKLEQLKVSKKPFQFLCSRISSRGEPIFDTDMTVAIEDYSIEEDASEGQALSISIQLKQYRNYSAPKPINIDTISSTATAETTRPQETAPVYKSYTVKSGDTLWNIAKRCLGEGSRYMEIYTLNKDLIKNPNLIYVGQVLALPN